MIKKISVLPFLVFIVLSGHAQDYQIDFSGSGQSILIDSIQVINLSQETSVRLMPGEVLQLVAQLGIHSRSENTQVLRIFPNPVKRSAQVEFDNACAGMYSIQILRETGCLVASQAAFIPQGVHQFEIANLSAGFYIVRISGSGKNYSIPLIALGDGRETPVIVNLGALKAVFSDQPDQNNTTIVRMQYNNGETLLFKGYSDHYARVQTLLPDHSQTVNFDFISCSDLSGNDYSVVTIGSQTWMAENLRTTMFSDGMAIPNVSGFNDWSSLVTPAYCWYDTNQVLYQAYGLLYNWYAVETNKICPEGWHVPSNSEWSELINYLSPQTTAGGKLKETGTTHWNTPNTGATNETGFSALPGGYRYGTGAFINIGNYGWWWASSSISDYGHDVNLIYNGQEVTTGASYKKTGLSIRCVKN